MTHIFGEPSIKLVTVNYIFRRICGNNSNSNRSKYILELGYVREYKLGINREVNIQGDCCYDVLRDRE